MVTKLGIRFRLRFELIWQILKDTFQQMRLGHIHLVASSLSFSTILALVPFFAIVLATFKSLGALEAYAPKVEVLLLSYLREAAGSEATKFIRIFLKNINARELGVTGFLLLGVTTMKLLTDMESCIHVIWGLPNTRPFYKRWLYQWIFLLIVPGIFAMYLAFISTSQMQVLVGWGLKRGLHYLFLVGILFVIYKLVPDIKVRSKSAVLSAISASWVLIGIHQGFILLAVKVFRYNIIYGSFAALPLILVWVLAIWLGILGGAALCSALERLQNRQETLGPRF